MTKMIDIPNGTGPDEAGIESVTIEFSLYQIDDWKTTDKFLVDIKGTVINLGEMDSSTDTSGTISGEDTKSGITWERETVMEGTDLGFGPLPDKKHIVQMTIPGSQIPNDKL